MNVLIEVLVILIKEVFKYVCWFIEVFVLMRNKMIVMIGIYLMDLK